MKEILETIAALPPETIEIFIAISNFGFLIYLIMFMLMSLAEAIYETALEKRWRRNSFIKYLDEDDIALINYHLSDTYLTSIHCQETIIGRIIVNAYQDKEDLKKFRKQKRKEFFDKLKFWK